MTFYVTANGTPPNFNGVSSANFTPPTSGNYTGVLYYQVPSNTQSPNFNGANVSFSGLVYAPGATSVNFNGASGGYLVLVVGAANFNGSSAYDFGQPPAGESELNGGVGTMRNFWRSQSGASLVEFAILAPVMLVLLVGLIEVGRYTFFAILPPMRHALVPRTALRIPKRPTTYPA